MIFYLGEKVDIPIEDRVRKAKNKTGSWTYGYHKDINTIIISKDGTLGEVFCINGINIGLPKKPDDKEIINHDKTILNQKWMREDMPAGLNEETQHHPKYQDYIDREFDRREKGVWIFLKGKPVYMTGLYYMFLQWMEQEEGFPNLRIIQNELMIYWEACVADDRCYGIQYVKNRRFGWSALCLAEMLNSGTIVMNKKLGLISKTGEDAQELFDRMVYSFKTMPCFFVPVAEGNTTPKKELSFAEPTRKKRKGEKAVVEQSLHTKIKWHATVLNKMDGGKVYRAAIDEAGKFPKDVPFTRYWNIVKTSHRLGRRIVGKAMVGSTVNALNDGGAEFKTVYKNSDPLDRNENDQTKSGLYRIFIPAKYCQEGFFDVYGFSIVEDPEVEVLTDLGDYTKIGAKRYFKNEANNLKDQPEDYNEFLRQFPDTDRDAFRDEADECSFSLVKLLDQIDHNDTELMDSYRGEGEYNGNTELERGNFTWKDGVQDTEVIWRPDPVNGRFYIAKGCHPPLQYRNQKESKNVNGVIAWAPLAEHIGAFGVDPYNRSKGADGRGSKGAIHLYTKTNTSDLPNETFILEYIDRAATVELFFEDVLMAMVYYSMPMLCELSNEKFLTMIKNRGYRHFSLNNPFKLYSELNASEKEWGGAPPQDSKIADQQFYAVEAYIYDYVGYADTDGKRPVGTMGYMPFTRTLMQWKGFSPDEKRTKYDAYISSSLALLANQRRTRKVVEQKKWENPFPKYDNSGTISVAK